MPQQSEMHHEPFASPDVLWAFLTHITHPICRSFSSFPLLLYFSNCFLLPSMCVESFYSICFWSVIFLRQARRNKVVLYLSIASSSSNEPENNSNDDDDNNNNNNNKKKQRRRRRDSGGEMSIQSGDAVEEFRRDRTLDFITDKGCHRGAGALCRYRESCKRPDEHDAVVVHQLTRSTPLPSNATDHYPFCQPPFLYPPRPQQPKAQSRNVAGRRGPAAVGEAKRKEEAEAAFRHNRSCEGGAGTRVEPMRSLDPIRALQPREIEALLEAERQEHAAEQAAREERIAQTTGDATIGGTKPSFISGGALPPHPYGSCMNTTMRHESTPRRRGGGLASPPPCPLLACGRGGPPPPLLQPSNPIHTKGSAERRRRSSNEDGVTSPNGGAVNNGCSSRDAFIPDISARLPTHYQPSSSTLSTADHCHTVAEERAESCCRPPPPHPSSPALLICMGTERMKAEKAERERKKTQAEVGSPLDFPDMPAKVEAFLDMSYLTKPSMHHRRAYHDASLANPFRPPRLADEWGGIDFFFRFLQRPELHPRVGGELQEGGERQRGAGIGGSRGRHDDRRRVGYALYGPAHASYCPANTASPLVERLHKRLKKLTAPERAAEAEAKRWQAYYAKARERKPYYPREQQGAPGVRAPMSGPEAIHALLEHREEDEQPPPKAEEEPATDVAAPHRTVLAGDAFAQAGFPVDSVKCFYERLKAQRAAEKQADLTYGEQFGCVARQPTPPTPPPPPPPPPPPEPVEAEKLFIEDSFGPPPPPYEHDGFGQIPFLHTDDVNYVRLVEQRASEKMTALEGFPRTCRRVFSLPPMFDVRPRPASHREEEEQEKTASAALDNTTSKRERESESQTTSSVDKNKQTNKQTKKKYNTNTNTNNNMFNSLALRRS
eukprot:gene8040-5593_t